jgi:actin-related protein
LIALNSIKDKEQRKRYYSNILIVGGGGQLQKLNEEIMLKLNTRLGFS